MFGAKGIMKENVLGQPPKSGMLKKKIFGAMPQGKAAAPFGQPSAGLGGGSLPPNPFAKQSAPKSLAKRLTGK